MTTATILAIDTCEKTCSAAILRGGDLLACRMEEIGRGHAERLLPLINELLEETEIEFAALTRIAVCTGPGTFTGLRIGLSVARGLALSLGIPCVGLTSLPILAAQASELFGAETSDRLHAVVMGRGGQGFYQMFRPTAAGLPVAASDPVSQDAEDIAASVKAFPGPVVGSGASLLQERSPVRAVDPGMLARLAADLDPAAFPPEPAYLREADAAKAKRLLPVEQ